MSPWPEGHSGAVTLSFDDAMPCHLAFVAPLLTQHNLRGTFYVNPTPQWSEKAREWRDVHAQGHEVGNHTLTHPCSCNFGWMSQRRGLEEMTLDEMDADIRQARAVLEMAIPEQRAHSFCYPCYQDFVGRGPTRQSYVPVVARYHSAARGGGESFNRPASVDLHYIWSTSCERMSGAEMIGLCEQAAEADGWRVLTFHGVGEGHLSVAEADFRALCAHLVRRADALWTAPLIEVASRLVDWRAASSGEAPPAVNAALPTVAR